MKNQFLQRRAFVVGSLALGSSLGAVAQQGSGAPWPSRPIRLVVAGTAGAGGDIFARLIAQPLQTALRQAVVVDPKPGANGLIACDTVAKAQADGYTLLFAPSSAVLINPVILDKMPYDPKKDLVPVTQVAAAGILLVANPAIGFRNLADMVAYARANPGKLAYGSWGTGSSGHLIMEGIKTHYGLDMPHVPYKSLTGEVADLIGNNISVGFADIASPIPHIRSGKLVALGTSGSQRWPATRDVPSLTEQGYRFDADGWYAVFAPAGTPKGIVDRLNAEINQVLATDGVRQKIEGQNMLVTKARSAEGFGELLKSEALVWQGLARVADLKEK
jgi:tripartite-type tricarboxylate transporter receptor subunit TctC